MKKILPYLIVFLLLINLVYAITFATIATQGLSIANPQVASLVNTAATAAGCVTTWVTCLQSYATKAATDETYGKILKAIEKESPEAIKAFTTYQQVNGYMQQGASIVQELKVNNQGQVEEGSMKFTKESKIGNIICKKCKEEDISISNSQITKKDGVTTITLDENGKLEILDKKTGEKNVYTNIQKGGFIKLDEEGNIDAAHFTVGKPPQGRKTAAFKFPYKRTDGSYKNIEYELPEGTTLDLSEYGTKITNIQQNSYTRIGPEDGTPLQFKSNKEGSYILLDKEGRFYGKGKIDVGYEKTTAYFNIESIDDSAEFAFKLDSDNGVIIGKGKVESNTGGYGFTVENEKDWVLIGSPRKDLNNYKGNWIRKKILTNDEKKEMGINLGGELLEASTYKGSKLNFDILPQDGIFKSDPLLKDRQLSFQLKGGSRLTAYKLIKNKGEAPMVTFHVGDGEAAIVNGNINFEIDKKQFNYPPKAPRNTKFIPMAFSYNKEEGEPSIGNYAIACGENPLERITTDFKISSCGLNLPNKDIDPIVKINPQSLPKGKSTTVASKSGDLKDPFN